MAMIRINTANGKFGVEAPEFVPYGDPVLDEKEAKKQALALYWWMWNNLPAMTMGALQEVLANEPASEAK